MTEPEQTGGLAGTDIAALLFTSAWLGLAGWLALTTFRPSFSDPLEIAAVIFGVVMPVALIWVAAGTARVARSLRLEGARLRAEMNLLRRSGAIAPVATPAPPLETAPPPRDPALVLSAKNTIPVAPSDAPPSVPASVNPLETGDLLRALDFPESENDQAGFTLLREAMAHPPTAQLVTATQNVLLLLREDGIRVKHLPLGATDAAAWRAFGRGMRGPEVDAVGAIEDDAALALTDKRVHGDAEFRRAAHYFLRNFDRFLSRFVTDASDDDILTLSQSRTGRAFMLVGGAIGVFD